MKSINILYVCKDIKKINYQIKEKLLNLDFEKKIFKVEYIKSEIYNNARKYIMKLVDNPNIYIGNKFFEEELIKNNIDLNKKYDIYFKIGCEKTNSYNKKDNIIILNICDNNINNENH